MSVSGIPQVRTFRAIGTTAVVAVTDDRVANDAAAILRAYLAALDRACSRFRDDAEISFLGRADEAPVRVSDLLFHVLSTACDVARFTGGAVDPTIGTALERLGYDRDFALLDGANETAPDGAPDPAPGWWSVDLDPEARTVRVPAGVRIDVGSSAKALAADDAATAIAGTLGTGALVSLGGDVAVAGPVPEGGWAVGVAAESSAPVEAVDQVVALTGGGLASSAPGARAWRRGASTRHHIVDPWTGECAATHWELVSVHAPTCVEANALSTAALVWGREAVDRLAGHGRPARLVGPDGEVLVVGGWPSGEPVAAPVPGPVPDRPPTGVAFAGDGGASR